MHAAESIDYAESFSESLGLGTKLVSYGQEEEGEGRRQGP